MAINGTAFHVEADDRSVLEGAATATNRGYTAEGVELEGTFTRGVFNLILAATYTHATITEDRINSALTGKDLHRQPDWVLVTCRNCVGGRPAKPPISLGAPSCRR